MDALIKQQIIYTSGKDDNVKEEILTKSQKLFQQFGLKKTTMDEIAAACNKGKSTLYHYFNSKEEIFDEVLNMELRSLRSVIKSRVDQQKSVKDKIMVYLLSFHKEILNKVNLYRIEKHEVIAESVANKYFSYLLEFERNYIIRILEDGYDAGEFTVYKKEDIPWFSEILIAAFLGIVRYSIETDEGLDQKKLEISVTTLIPKLFP